MFQKRLFRFEISSILFINANLESNPIRLKSTNRHKYYFRFV